MNKLVAILFCAYVVGALAGCGSSEPAKTTPEQVKEFKGNPSDPDTQAALRKSMGQGAPAGGAPAGGTPQGPAAPGN